MEQMQFKVSSALKDLVGKDLIINDNIAIFELVKNSYDAYATKVEITFGNDKIIIADNGKGMSFNDLKEKWLFLGYSAKKDGTEDNQHDKQKSYRDNIKRHYAGAKGIGRFSCDRLGRLLTLTTKSESSRITETIIVDWTEFEIDQKKEFAQINVKHSSIEDKILSFPENKDTGTILEITHLNDEKNPWNRKRLLDLKRSLEKLINPLSETNDFTIEIICEHEKKEDDNIKRNNGYDRDIVNGVLKNSISKILKLKTTQIDVKLEGNFIWTTLSDRGVDIYKIKEHNIEFNKLRDVDINLYFLNRSAKNNFTRLMGIEPVNYGSIFLFRNGFRIMPFGNTGDDSWGLDYRAQQGRNRRLGTRDLFGRVDVVTDNINELKEVSSRDGGLIETQTSKQLFTLFNIAHRRLERYVSGVLWGEAFLRKEYFANEVEALQQRKELLDIDKDEENPNYILSSSIGSKIDFIQLIKTLAKDKNIEILYYNTDLANILASDDLIHTIKPQFIKDLEKIAEETNDSNLLFSIDEAKRRIEELQKEKEKAEKKAFEEEQKRIKAEELAQKAEMAKQEAEKQRELERERKLAALLQAKEAELKRREEEVLRKEAEQKKREESEKRIKAELAKEQAESRLQKKSEQLKIITSLSSQDLEAVTNLHHQTNVVADNINAMITQFSRRLVKNEPVAYNKVIDFLKNISLENSKIISFSRFGIRNIFDDFTTKKEYDIIEFLKNYINKITKQFSGSRININFSSSANMAFITSFAPIDISIIVDNMVSNAKKAQANLLEIIIEASKGILQMHFISNQPFNKDIGNINDIFERGFSTTKSTGMGLYHIKNIVDENKWKIIANRKEKEAEFIIIIENENRL